MSDIIESIGRQLDLYKRFALAPTLLEVSPEADMEIKRLLGAKAVDTLGAFKLGPNGDYARYQVNPKMVGKDAFKIHTALGVTPPEVAIRRAFINRSQAIPQDLFHVHPKLKLS